MFKLLERPQAPIASTPMRGEGKAIAYAVRFLVVALTSWSNFLTPLYFFQPAV